MEDTREQAPEWEYCCFLPAAFHVREVEIFLLYFILRNQYYARTSNFIAQSVSRGKYYVGTLFKTIWKQPA